MCMYVHVQSKSQTHMLNLIKLMGIKKITQMCNSRIQFPFYN